MNIIKIISCQLNVKCEIYNKRFGKQTFNSRQTDIDMIFYKTAWKRILFWDWRPCFCQLVGLVVFEDWENKILKEQKLALNWQHLWTYHKNYDSRRFGFFKTAMFDMIKYFLCEAFIANHNNVLYARLSIIGFTKLIQKEYISIENCVLQ